MDRVIIAGQIGSLGRVQQSRGAFTVVRRGAGRYSVTTVKGTELAFGQVLALVRSDEGTLAHYTGDGNTGEIHTVRADDGSYVDCEVEFVLYRVA